MRKRKVNNMKLENSTKISHPSHTLPRAIQKKIRRSTNRLSTWQVAAGHDGQAVAALERAELACISCSLEVK